MIIRFFTTFALVCIIGVAELHADSCCNLFRDLELVNWVNESNREIPVTYNHLLQGGYIQMPSARVGCEGEIGFGYSHVPPYYNWNARVQILDRLEVTINYRIFRGVEDPLLSQFGFGWLSDKGANVKFVVLDPNFCGSCLPGIAIGANDFMGTKSFEGQYVVFTQVFPKYNLECSFGLGPKRLTDVFGGVIWMPFWNNPNWPLLNHLALVAEWDPVKYQLEHYEPNPFGRVKNSYFNWGAKYRLYDFLDFSFSRIRGDEWAASISGFYNFGKKQGFFPKYNDPLPFYGPPRLEPLCLDHSEEWINDLSFAFCEQGFEVLDITLSEDHCGSQTLRIKLINTTWNEECEVHRRLTPLVVSFVPSNISHTVVTLEESGFAIQEYHFPMCFVRDYSNRNICNFQYRLLTPYKEVGCLYAESFERLYHQNKDAWNVYVLPRTNTFFGSARGKLKYSLGVDVNVTGYLFNKIYYSVLIGKNLINDLKCLTGVDILNPSQLPNVRTDTPLYLKNEGIIVDEMYAQMNHNLGCGIFGRVSAGLFETAYGGVAFETLYYPVGSRFAFGFEAAFMKKREYTGIGFTNKIRQFDGFKKEFFGFRAFQGFFNFYYDFPVCNIDFHIKAGKFLADDYGARFELAKYYPSGMRIFAWYTLTNGNDRLNGSTYYDKGVGVSIPMDYLLTYSSRKKLTYSMSAWLRDVGASAYTGESLYWTIRDQR
ncbi:MAG: YjbH domain-containing protein [Waddliaceae bacterium]